MATRAGASTATRVSPDMSITRPPCRSDLPAQSWPPPRTDSARSWLRTARTADCTSAADSGRTISAGSWVTAAFQICTLASYAEPDRTRSAGRSTSKFREGGAITWVSFVMSASFSVR